MENVNLTFSRRNNLLVGRTIWSFIHFLIRSLYIYLNRNWLGLRKLMEKTDHVPEYSLYILFLISFRSRFFFIIFFDDGFTKGRYLWVCVCVCQREWERERVRRESLCRLCLHHHIIIGVFINYNTWPNYTLYKYRQRVQDEWLLDCFLP
jgi:hypothetical protein